VNLLVRLVDQCFTPTLLHRRPDLRTRGGEKPPTSRSCPTTSGTPCSSAATPGLPLVLDENSSPDPMPWLAWNFIPEDKCHGVFIELATRYQAGPDRWLPHPGTPRTGS
jgi:hypothetical protein